MKEITKQLACVVMRNGVEIWLELERAERMKEMLQSSNPPQFMTFENRVLNRADLVGIFEAQDMEELTRRKNGQIKCKSGNWHDKKETCSCLTQKEEDKVKEREQAITECGKCMSGWVQTENGMAQCSCLNGIVEPIKDFQETKPTPPDKGLTPISETLSA